MLAIPLSVVVVLQYEAIAALLWEHGSVQATATAMAVCSATIVWEVAFGTPLKLGRSILRVLSGGVFGALAAKLAIGVGLNENLQTVAAGVGGATGPQHINAVAQKFLGDGKDKA